MNITKINGPILAETGEAIPDGVALLGREDLTEEELLYATTVVEERAKKWLEKRKP